MSTLTDVYITNFEGSFNIEKRLLCLPAPHRGYHSTLPTGTLVHTLRESAQCGLAKLLKWLITMEETVELMNLRIIFINGYGNFSAVITILTWEKSQDLTAGLIL